MLVIKEPENFQEAINCKETEKWQNAMREELASLHMNKVCTVVGRPTEKKTVGCKWMYKTKIDDLGSVIRYKARLTAKGYTQKASIDHDELFSPVARYESIRTVIAATVHRKHKM